jgi:photosystem II stability/assembly factor-like uncharacterized protein
MRRLTLFTSSCFFLPCGEKSTDKPYLGRTNILETTADRAIWRRHVPEKQTDVRELSTGKPAFTPRWQLYLNVKAMRNLLIGAILAFLALPSSVIAQHLLEESLFQALQWRQIGPFRGGRCVAVAGHPQQPLTFFLGSTGGGVWKTEDAGLNWQNVSDGYFNTGSIGAIAVAPSDPNVLYVGTGEHPIRGTMSSHGDGVYKSTDGGKTWAHLGLAATRHISAIQIHPTNPEVVYVAAQGAAYGPSSERGVYRSLDGGATWQHILYLDERTGASSLSLDTHNPRILYAGLWDHQRQPWSMRSGGPGSGLYKSTDGGTNWEKLSNGLPTQMGKVGLSVSPADPAVVYAIIEAEKGGVFRSNDRGNSWVLVNDRRIAVARAWYYTKIVADPHDADRVYVLNAPLLKSTDGGRSFTHLPTPHHDHHALWINPENPAIMVLGNDGGGTISLNGGKSWSTQHNQPTAQLYRVIADRRFPFYLYAGQQDNTTLAIPHRTFGPGIGLQDWYPVSGGESAFIAFDPDDPTLVYGTSYQGRLSVYDHRTKMTKDLMAHPALGVATPPREMRYRFNWNAPLVAQPQNPQVLYHAANVVFRSENGGLSWTVISPDLTCDELDKQGPGGGPYTNEGAGGENYNTISYLACSPQQAGTLWAGTDDGRLHLTRDEGQSWSEVTPPSLGEALIHAIELSPHHSGTAYIAATRYKFNDLQPLIFKTEDYGQSWRKIVAGIDPAHFARVVREDPVQPGLLYAGTEGGFYVSFDDGQRWQRLQLNLPICPIMDLLVHENTLVAATSGRSFWILDDLGPLQQSKGHLGEQALLFAPKPAVRLVAASPGMGLPAQPFGHNPPDGLLLYYYLPQELDSASLRLDVIDASGHVLRSFRCQTAAEKTSYYPGGPPREPGLTAFHGLNVFQWDLRRQPLPGIPGQYIRGCYQGGLVPPGDYTLRLTTPSGVLVQTGTVLPHPLLDTQPDDYQQQQEVLVSIEQAVRDIHLSVQQMREVRQQIERLTVMLARLDCTAELLQAGSALLEAIADWEAYLVQPRQETFQDVINFPNRLSAELLFLKEQVDGYDPRVSASAQSRLEELLGQWARHKAQMQHIAGPQLALFNQIYREQQLPVVLIPPRDE